MKILHNISLLPYNTFKIDVKCNEFIEYNSLEELISIQKDIQEKFLHIGQGSNLLFTKDYEGTILHSAIKGIEVISETDSEVILEVGSGEVWDDVVEYCVNHGYYGTENLSLIPGEMGSAAVQNIGAYGAEVKDVIKYVCALSHPNGELQTFNIDECCYSYRNSIFKTDLKGKYFIYKIGLRLTKSFVPKLEYGGLKSYISGKGLNPSNISAKMLRECIIEIRNSKLPDPNNIGNAGSFFMNPVVDYGKYEELIAEYPNMPHYAVENGVKIPAGWMIEQCGWKGKSLGNAAVYEKQALVLINKGGASGKDVQNLCEAIVNDVFNKFGITIKPEVNII